MLLQYTLCKRQVKIEKKKKSNPVQRVFRAKTYPYLPNPNTVKHNPSQK